LPTNATASTPIRLVDLPARLPRRGDGARVDFSTVWEWATSGPDAHRLATTIAGGQRYTTLAAVGEFLDRSIFNNQKKETRNEQKDHRR